MVCGLSETAPCSVSVYLWLYKAEKGCGAGLYLMDRLFKRSDSGISCHEAGNEGNRTVSLVPDAAVYLLYGGISDASVVSVRLSGSAVESFKNCMLFFVYADRDSSGMLCKSSNRKNVSAYNINDVRSMRCGVIRGIMEQNTFWANSI